MSEEKQSTQQRFLIAAVLSMLVLTVWTYFFAPSKPPAANTNTAANTVAANTATTAPEVPQNNQAPQTVAATSPDNTPNRVITIKTPIYQTKIDSKGALATSWILIKNVHDQHEKLLFADGANQNGGKPLELISQKALETRQIPFRLSTGDPNLDTFLNDRNYQVSQTEETIELNDGATKQIDFVLKDESGLEVVKSFVFRADSYVTDLSVKALRNGQPILNTELLIGASIGDQAIVHHNYYHIEPEAVALVDGKSQHYGGAAFTYNNNEAVKTFNGQIDWVGVGDTYFAMAAIPSQPVQSVEFHASTYKVPVEPFYNGVIDWITRKQTTELTNHLVSTYIPVLTDGTPTKIYTGSKDYFTISQYSDNLGNAVGRNIYLENFINWGWTGTITKPIATRLLWSLNFIFGFVGNYGVAIIIFTLIFYSLFFPLRWYQSKSFKKAQSNAPKMKEVQDKIKDLQNKGVPLDDPRMRELQMEQLRMMKGAIPLGGCLPLLLQMPLFIALYVAVTISLDFRQASFLWLPDLSAGDPWHLLEFLFAGSMAGSMILTPTTPAVTPEQQMQQKMMMYLMPAMMLFVMWGAPAGLLLYWFFGNIVSFIQQFIINRLNKTNEPPPTEEVVKTVGKKAKPKLSTS